jgi:hypothetical protein
MPRKVPTALEKLAALETKRQAVLEERKKELLSIIEKCDALSIDDHLLAGLLLFAQDPNNKDHRILQEFYNLTKAAKVRVKSKPASQKTKS